MNMIKRVIAGCVMMSMVLATIVTVSLKVEATDTTAVYYDETNTYKIGDYWSEEEKKVPVKAGYVFGGWYQKDGDNYVPLKEADLNNETVKQATAYPKFVPAKYFSIKSHVGTQTNDGTTLTSLRMISLVDSNKYQEAGFEYQLGSREVARVQMESIYTGIKLSETDEQPVRPEDVYGTDATGYYFIAFDVSDISTKSFASIVYARPYWVTMDGTEVMGLSRNNRVEDNDDNGEEYLSVPVNLLTDGLKTANVAAGKIVVTYNKDKFAVASEDSTYKVDVGRVLKDMNCHVDAAAGTITFVGNVKDAGNVVADGLYANIRFKKTDESASDSELNMAISMKQFCNWAEDFIDSDLIVVQ